MWYSAKYANVKNEELHFFKPKPLFGDTSVMKNVVKLLLVLGLPLCGFCLWWYMCGTTDEISLGHKFGKRENITENILKSALGPFSARTYLTFVSLKSPFPAPTNSYGYWQRINKISFHHTVHMYKKSTSSITIKTITTFDISSQHKRLLPSHQIHLA